MQVIVDSLITHYDKQGSANKYILLLHGWGDTLLTFEKLQKDLSRDYTVVSVDLPGFGDTQIPPEVWELDDYADFVRLFLQKIGVKKLHAVVGHSNGGALALRAVSTKKLMPQKLILIAASGIRNKNGVRKLVIKIVAKTGKGILFWLPNKYKRALQKRLYGVVGSDMLVAPHMQETFKKTVKQDVQSDAASINVETLLMYGSSDTATPVKFGEIYQKIIKDAKLEVVNAGHFIHQEEPTLTYNKIKEFLC